jgi:hypothetical protein
MQCEGCGKSADQGCLGPVNEWTWMAGQSLSHRDFCKSATQSRVHVH